MTHDGTTDDRAAGQSPTRCTPPPTTGGAREPTSAVAPPDERAGSRFDRRSLLAATATGLSIATAGCIREARSAINRTRLEGLSLSMIVQPPDGDHQSIQIARRIGDNLEAAGIDVSIHLRATEEFHRQVLVNHDFDLYVGRHPGGTDPDILYEALYSRYGEESGWQNPFGFTDPRTDDLLERQRTAEGDERETAVEELLDQFAVEQPFVPICRPAEIRLGRTTRFDGWNEHRLGTRLGYLDLEAGSDVEADGDPNSGNTEPLGRLRGTVIYPSFSENLNPLSVEYRNKELLVELLYDSLAILEPDTGDVVPWLADDWHWDDETGTLEVSIREGHAFHDDEPLTAEDVAFTYRFLADTSLGSSDVRAPAPRYRGLSGAIDAVEVDADDEYRLELAVDGNETVAERALLVPVLPEHVWRPRSESARVPGFELAQGTTEALVTTNVPAVGSGPFAFDDVAARDYLELERFEEHFTLREDVDLPAATASSIRIQIDPRSPSAIALVEGDDSDITLSSLEAYAIDDIEETESLRRLDGESTTFYHLGFNVRRAPFSNPYFRQAVAQVIDKAWLVEEVFRGYAEPIASPLPDEWTPAEHAFDGGDPNVPFRGSDGDLDVVAARSAFEDAGYHYDGGRLVVRD